MKGKSIRNVIAGTAVAAATALGTVDQAKAQGTPLFNLDINFISLNGQTTTLNSGYTIPGHTAINVHLTGVDFSLANATVNGDPALMGSMYVDMMTTSGMVSTAPTPFALFSWIQPGNLAVIEIDSQPADGPWVSANQAVPSGFAFNSVADYSQLFANINANGVLYPNTGAGSVLGTHLVAQSFQLQPVPEPSTFALFGMGAAGLALALGRRQKVSSKLQPKPETTTIER